MTVLSGGLVYEWSEEPSDYGLVQINTDNSVKLLGDYETLRKKYDTLNINLLEHQNSTATSLKPPQCDSSLISGGGFSTNFNIPETPQGGDDLISNGIANPPTGSIVKVTQTIVQYAVTEANGEKINNLQIHPGATQPNYPGAVNGFATTAGSIGNGGSSGGSTGSSSGAAPAPTMADQRVLSNAVAVAALGAVAFAL